MAINMMRQQPAMVKTGEKRSTFNNKVKSGLISKPIFLSPRVKVWPEHELEAINRAWLAGNNEDQIRELVKTLEEGRMEIRPTLEDLCVREAS